MFIGVTNDFPVRLYASDISDDDGSFRKWYGLMPEGRRARCDRFRQEADRRRCISSYRLLVEALRDLQEDTGVIGSAEALRMMEEGRLLITEEPGGRPVLKDIPVCFNISHSKDRVAVALSHTHVGCDVECRNANALSVAKRFFAKEEYRLLSGIKEESARDLLFTQLWTMKESVVKCSGEGLKRSISDFSLVDEDGNIIETIRLSGVDRDYRVKTFESENGYCYSICSEHDITEDRIRFIQRRCFTK